MAIWQNPTNQVFYGWNQNKEKIKECKTAWIVEAEKTVLKFDSWGCNKCLAVFGSKISKEHINKLLQLGVETVVLMLDSDFHSKEDEEYKLTEKEFNLQKSEVEDICWLSKNDIEDLIIKDMFRPSSAEQYFKFIKNI